MTENEIHEGKIEHMITCWDENDSQHRCSTPIKEPDLLKHNLKEGDKVRYSIDSDGYAVVTGRVDIIKIVEKTI